MRVGVLGGGQLARMLALEGIPLGHRFTILEPGADAPAATLGSVVAAAYDDPDGLRRVAAASDVVTYEFENVPARSAAYLAARLPALPPPVALEVAQDRLAEKTMFRELGIATPAFHPIDGPGDVEPAIGRDRSSCGDQDPQAGVRRKGSGGGADGRRWGCVAAERLGSGTRHKWTRTQRTGH